MNPAPQNETIVQPWLVGTYVGESTHSKVERFCASRFRSHRIPLSPESCSHARCEGSLELRAAKAWLARGLRWESGRG